MAIGDSDNKAWLASPADAKSGSQLRLCLEARRYVPEQAHENLRSLHTWILRVCARNLAIYLCSNYLFR